MQASLQVIIWLMHTDLAVIKAGAEQQHITKHFEKGQQE